MENYEMDSVVIVGVIMVLLSNFIPAFIIPTVVVLFLPILKNSSPFKRKAAKNDNEIDFDGEDEMTVLAWNSLPDKGEFVVQSLEFRALNLLAVPWDIPMPSMPELINPSGKQSGFALASNWMGIGETEAFAFRKEFNDVQTVKFIRVGRFLSPQTKNPFLSPFDNPVMEDAALSIEDDVSAPVIKQSSSSEILRCGDVFQLQCSATKRFLVVHKGYWVGLTNGAPGPKGLFQLTLLNDEGEVMFGAPLIEGMPFRLRSARWPHLEVGLQVGDTANDKGGAALALSEWPPRHHRGPLRSKNGFSFNPMNMCIVSSVPRALEVDKPIFSFLTQSYNMFAHQPEFHVDAIGWIYTVNRTTLQPVFSIIFLSRQDAPKGKLKSWISIRAVAEFEQVLQSLEQVTFTNECTRLDVGKKEPAEGGEEAESDALTEGQGFHGYSFTPTSLYHETPTDQTFRAFKQRLSKILEFDLLRPSRWLFGRSIKGTIVPTRSVLKKYFSQPTAIDSQFLINCPEMLGVQIPSTPTLSTPLFFVTVGRSIWESFWGEEILVVYPGQVACFPPGSKKPIWTLLLADLISANVLDEKLSPLPGYFGLELHTLGRVHMIVFNTAISRDKTRDVIIEQAGALPSDIIPGPPPPPPSHGSATNSLKGPKRVFGRLFNQGGGAVASGADDRNHDAPKAGSSEAADKLILQTGQWLPPTRRVLNGRKFTFDLYPGCYGPAAAAIGIHKGEPHWALAARLLKGAFDLLPSTGDDDLEEDMGLTPGPVGAGQGIPVEKLMKFMDDTAALRTVDLSKIKPDSAEGLCFFLNIYHTLLVHARAVLGAPTKTDWAYFFGNACYEIGGDVFSLAELEQCVIRGNLSRPKDHNRTSDTPLIHSGDSHFTYALQNVDPRINFILNCGSVSNPPVIFIVTPKTLEKQMQKATQVSLGYSISVDMKTRTVTLPKICDIYRADFGDDLLVECEKFLNGTKHGIDLKEVLEFDLKLAVKFLKFNKESAIKLKLMNI